VYNILRVISAYSAHFYYHYVSNTVFFSGISF